ncbi:MAG: AMP-binding protein [Tsuneonella suprasediminis]|uniref:Propionyl-CoA synthetase n=1 Tax=Tsuneonella suprasediminis TaxID=2306996 RepID=A0A419R3W9_9SPHN|nr:AMP-binding protein [Tsuneonella suprasediminis]RJX69211.1 propionyl-CoA synthetase [Tsuneonella suprasediminis]UBS34041.1 AMP-binding protein [Altererythrobacter sp. N1]
MTFAEIAARAENDPDAFWMDAARGLDWAKFPQTPHDRDGDVWFPDGEINTCHNAVDRHVAAGRGDTAALIYESPITGATATYSFADLQERVARTAGMLVAEGVERGDRVVIYMPMIPEAVFAMLACARIGAVHSVVFGGFAAPELAKRIDDCQPKLVLSASCGFEPGRTIAYKPLLDNALSRATHKPVATIVFQREELAADLMPGRDRDWAAAYDAADPVDCVTVKASDPLYILYTSGTTGTPKGVVRDNGGHATVLHWSMGAIYGVDTGDVYWAASDIGWVVGHSYIVYGPLLKGCATVLFEGKPIGTPDAGIFWQLVDKHDVKVLFTAPTAIRAIRRADPEGEFIDAASLDSLQALFLAGERADPDTLLWIAEKLGKPVIDHWWQTELGWPAIATCYGLGQTHIRAGSAGHAVPGYRFKVKDAGGQDMPAGAVGTLLIEQPLPPGAFRTLWNNPERFAAGFMDYPGHYTTGDAGKIDEDGFIHIMGRTDDIINVAGHRLSTGQMEEVVANHPQVVECAVVGAADELKGEMAVAFVVTKPGFADHEEAKYEIVTSIRGDIGPIAAPRAIYFVDGLPKTRSGKILRNLLRDIVNGADVVVPQTIEDPAVITHVQERAAG